MKKGSADDMIKAASRSETRTGKGEKSMQIKKNAWSIGAASFALLTLFGNAPGRQDLRKLPPEISALLPANAKNITGEFSAGPGTKTNMSGGDIYGEVPNTRDCNHLGKGTIHIKLWVVTGEYADHMLDIYRRGIPGKIDEERKARQKAMEWKDDPFVSKWGPVQEEEVPGGRAISFETDGPCVEDENPSYHGVAVRGYSVQGSAYAEVEIGLRGEMAVAKAMLVETLDKIAQTDFVKLAKH
jgi:hypothetical protein